MATPKEKLHELRRSKVAKQAEYKAIIAKETDMPEGENLPQEEVDRLSAIEADITGLTSRIARLETALEMDGESAEPTGSGEGDGDVSRGMGGHLDPDGRITPFGFGEKQAAAAIAADPLKGKGFKMARYCMGVLMAKGGGGFAGAAAAIERRFGDKEVAKALNTAGVSTGGALIPQDFSSDFIELLRADEVIRQCNPVVLPMPLGNMTIPRLAAGATAGFQGELDDIPSSQETFDDVQLNAKKLTALVPVSNDLIRRAPIGVEALIRDDLVSTAARRADLAMMIGDGSGGSVIGLINQAAAQMKLTVNAFADNTNGTIFTAVSGTLFGMRALLKANMSRMIRPVWLLAPYTEAFLMGLINQFGNYPYKDEMEAGKLLGIPYKVTQQLPTNINTGTVGSPVNNGGYLFLVDFADVIIGDTLNVTVDATDVGSYKDSGGNLVSTFVRDQTAIRVIHEFDFAVRHQASVCVAVLPGWLPAGTTGISGLAYYSQALTTDMSAAPSTWGSAAPTGSNNPGNVAAAVAGGTLPGRI